MERSIDSRLRRLEDMKPRTLVGLFVVDGETVKMDVRDAVLPRAELLRIVGGNSVADLDAYLASFKAAVGREAI